MTPAFAASLPLALSPPAPCLSSSRPTFRTARAALDLIPGVPPGEDVRDNAPMRSYVPRPVEDYSKRGFATPLPLTWAGETGTIGVADIDQSLTAESVAAAAANILPEDAASKGALGDYARLVADDRRAALAKFDEPQVVEGRATCGESEGRKYVSNYNPKLISGTGWGEYWVRK